MRCITTFVLLVALLCAQSNGQRVLQRFDYISNSPQNFQVPSNVFRIRVTAVGALGGKQYQTSDTLRGRGMNVSSTFFAQPGQMFSVIVGQRGFDSKNPYSWGTNYGAGGGGGGTFFYAQYDAFPMVAAGGGGGGGHTSYAQYDDYAYGRDAQAGQAGGANYNNIPGGVAAGDSSAQGGKGWNTIKTDATGNTNGGTWGGNGGYGGGGAAMSTGNEPYSQGAGGGGGYSGGAGGIFNYPGGGGGGSYAHSTGSSSSYVVASFPGYTSSGHGYLIVEAVVGCDENSDYDLANVTCICRSGYSGPGCTVGPDTCPEQVPQYNVTYPYPRIETRYPAKVARFDGDSLKLSVWGPYVKTRRYTKLSFVGAQETGPCNLVGRQSYWTKLFNLESQQCEDEIALVMPWTAAKNCGFKKVESSGGYDYYSNKIQLTFVETMGVSYGVPLTRTSSHTYDVNVYFPNSLIVVLNNTQVSATVQLDMVLTAQKYEPLAQAGSVAGSGVLTLEFTTVTPWSGRLDANMGVATPMGISLLSVAAPTMGACTISSGTACSQTYVMRFQLQNATASQCTFDGVYQLNSTIYACRQTDRQCSSAPVGISFQLQSGSVCAAVDVRPAVTGEMAAFASNDFSKDTVSSFNLGDRVFFRVTTNAGLNNHVALNFTSIKYIMGGQDTVLWDTSRPTYQTPEGTLVSLTISNANKYFSVYFSGVVFNIDFGTKENIAFVATATVIFPGNKKRNVEMMWDASEIADHVGTAMQVASIVGVANNDESTIIKPETTVVKPVAGTVNVPVNNVLPAGFSLASVVGIAVGGVVVGVVVVLGAVFAVYKRMQSQLYTPVPANA